MKGKVFAVVVAAVLAAQFALLAHLVLRWERIVRDGVECRFKCNVYDPRDPFRGRFVRVAVTAPVECGAMTNGNCHCKGYVRLEPTGGTNGLSRAVEIAAVPRPEGIWIGPRKCTWDYRLGWNAQKTNETWKAFQERREASGKIWRTDLPGQFFVNEKTAPQADKLVRSRTNDVVAVYRVCDRKIVIVGIEVNGVPLGDDLTALPPAAGQARGSDRGR